MHSFDLKDTKFQRIRGYKNLCNTPTHRMMSQLIVSNQNRLLILEHGISRYSL